MCGIVGIFCFNGASPSEEILRSMAAKIAHRGPDDEGFLVNGQVGLGMRRLSIIDVSGGKQPIFSEDGSVCVVCNGEIYNYKELTKDLLDRGHVFRSHSDTETLVHLYEEYGRDFVSRLNGMFAFALWDANRASLLVSRDRVGIKPLSYYLDDRTFVFGSEIKSLLACPDVVTSPNESAVMDYLIKGKYLFTQTFFKNIVHLPPGHTMTLNASGVEIREYWDFRFGCTGHDSVEDLSRVLASTIDESVKSQLMSEVPIGSYLSGGIDSSAVATAAAKASSGQIGTFSAVFPGFDAFNEDRFQQDVVRATNVDHHVNELKAENFLEDLKELIWHTEQPLAGITIGQYQMARFTKQWVTVVLTGHGGDELFGGYPNHLVGTFMDRLKWGWLRPSGWPGLLSELRRDIAELGFVKIVYNVILFGKPFAFFRASTLKFYESRQMRKRFTPEFCNRHQDHFTHNIVFHLLNKSNAKTWLDRMLYVDIKLWLHNILIVEDKESMAHSLEDRVPLLDNRVIDLAAKIPSSEKIKNGVLKDVLIRSQRDRLPTSLLVHKKMGFPQPIGEWIKQPDIRSRVEHLLLEGDVVRKGIIQKAFARELLKSHYEGDGDHSFTLWQLICVELWFSVFFPERNGSPKKAST